MSVRTPGPSFRAPPRRQATAKNAKMDEVREYMGMRKLPKSLQLKMRKHFDHVYSNMSVFREVSAPPAPT